MNDKGVALVLVLIAVAVLSVLGAAIVMRSINEGNLTIRHSRSTQAFWFAEAGINRALNELKTDYTTIGSQLWSTQVGDGSYYIDVVEVDANRKKITAHGVFGNGQAERIVEAMVNKEIPAGFFDNAIYVAGEADFNGSAYSVAGNVVYGGEVNYSSNNVSGSITQDESITPLASLNYSELLSVSQGQGNVYSKNAQNKYINEATGQEGFPSSFWYQEPTDPNDPATGVPNVVYVTDDLVLNGNIGTIGGFYVVVGNVISDPTATEDTTINGNGTIEGCIYTRGEFEVNGGGNGLNVNGGVWAGSEVELRGASLVTYSSDYMDAIASLDITPEAQIISWRDTQNPYQVSQ